MKLRHKDADTIELHFKNGNIFFFGILIRKNKQKKSLQKILNITKGIVYQNYLFSGNTFFSRKLSKVGDATLIM